MRRQSALCIGAALASSLLLASLAGPAATAQEFQPIPPLGSRVIDLTGTLTANQKSRLEARLAGFEERKGAQIAVLIVPTTQPEEIEQYSIRVVDAWKLGREEPDDGALLLVAKHDRVMRIEVGQGLEGALTDFASKRIIADTITPYFRQGDFAGGISAGIGQMIGVIDGEPLPEPDAKWGGGAGNLAEALPLLLGLVFMGSVVLRALLGRALGSLAIGAATGGFVWWVTKMPGLAIGIGIAALVAALVLGFQRSGRWSSRPGHGGWSPGGWGGGGFGSGGTGGGGFSGGGGSFGGGGASGRW